ncbi:uncharacterized protein CTHT_0010380 [Thermochaetoides thermophila DSM 1495]|uniref:Uncharacterized protein n=1 Tax=Chaetomium thermophilum (strain DSM 1495 / CBS 144.50 / IMI 039719) TaxID=759272 RepID=G0S0K9_CHATD|nr:hypothetical protein CTHT_0010380 [Thermochaetoides thermophila DSM 1495]EGS22569.1 hypothetical protein CTHT_0010380 [Thermochaetoides thermophila DSM 1495]
MGRNSLLLLQSRYWKCTLVEIAPSSAGALAALKRAREEKVKEFNAFISIAEKLLRAIEDVGRNLDGTLEKKVGKPIIARLHSFLIQSTMA